MKKIFTLIAMALVAMGASADTLIKYNGEAEATAGITLSGSTVMGSAKINTNTETQNGIALANGYSSNDVYNENSVVLDYNGGFKAGDVLTIKGFINNSDQVKQGGVCIFTIGEENKTTMVAHSGIFLNGRFADGLTEWTYTLESDMDKIYLGRYAEANATKSYLAYIEVSRGGSSGEGGGDVTPEAGVYTFNNDAATYKIVDNCEATTYTMDNLEGFSVNYTAASEKMHVAVAANEAIEFEYSNSAVKNNIIKTGSDFVQFDSKNFVIIVSGLKAGNMVSIDYTAKGGTAATMTNAGNDNTEVVAGSVDTNADKKATVTYTVKAVKNGSIKIKETAGGFRLHKLSILDETSGINNITTESKSSAIYNIAGQRVNANMKGLVIKNGKKYIVK